MKRMKINVHAGHCPDGKGAYGAVGLIKESTEARKVKKEVIRQLRELGHTVYDCTVEYKTTKSGCLADIVKKCNENKVDLDVSIHFNACVNDLTGDGKSTGTEVYIYSGTSKAKPYAEKVLNEIVKLGFKNRGVKERPGLYVLKHTKSPAMLIECCFVDDADDVKLYKVDTMASAIVKGIAGKTAEKPATGSAATSGSKLYRVQLGAYGKKENAEKLVQELKAKGFDAFIKEC